MSSASTGRIRPQNCPVEKIGPLAFRRSSMFPEGNVPGYVCNPGSPRERDAASQGHTSGIPTRALLHSWKLAPAAHHVLLSILVVTSPAPDVWLSILTDYTYDSELDIADGVPLAFRRSVSFPRGTRVTYVTWDVLNHLSVQFQSLKHLPIQLQLIQLT